MSLARRTIFDLSYLVAVVAASDIRSATTSPAEGIPGAGVTARGIAAPESSVGRSEDVFNLRDYRATPCNTVSQQTAAFYHVEAMINAAGGGSLYIPMGTNWQFDAGVSGPMVFSTYSASIRGAGVWSTTIVVTRGAFVKWTVAVSQANGGHGSMSDLRLYEQDNPTSGAQVELDRVNGFDYSNVWFGGGFISLDLASAVGVHGTNVTIEGNSSTPGSILLRVHRANENAGHSPENNFANLNLRGASGRTVTNSLVVNDSDGLWLNGDHIGFAVAEAFLLHPEYISDVIDNIHSIGVDYDTAAYGVRFTPLTGWRSEGGNDEFVGGLAELMDNDGFRVDDPHVVRLVLDGFSTLRAGAYGINIAGGQHITISGGDHAGNNQKNTGTSHIRIGGTAAFISVSGVSYRAWHTPTVNNLQISDSADFVSVGPSVYSGASAADVQIASSGTHISGSPDVTDRPADQVLGGRGVKGVPASYVAQSSNPTATDIPSGQCIPWRNTSDDSIKYYCDVSGTLKSTTLK